MEKKAATKRLITPVGRLCFPAIFEKAKKMEGDTGEPKYEITLVFDTAYLKKNPDELVRFNELKKQMNEVCVDKFKKPFADVKAKMPNFGGPFRNGEEKEHLAGFGPGTVFIHPKSTRRPGVVGPDRVTVITDPAALYPGCYVRASVHAFAYDNRSKGITFSLDNVMFVRDGERLDGQTNPEEDFGEAPIGDVAEETDGISDDLI